MFVVQLHEFAGRGQGFVHYSLEVGSTMTDLQDRKSRAIEVENGAAGLFKYFFRQDTGAGIEIMDHWLLVLEGQRYLVESKFPQLVSSTAATPPEMANFIASAELMSVRMRTRSLFTK